MRQAGFWPGLLFDWQPNYPAQPWAMFATYWLVHAGPGHLIGNLAGVAWLGTRLSAPLGPGRLAQVWVAAVLGGAIAYGFLAAGPSPMIGASGGLFGLLGAFVVADARSAAARGARRAALRAGAICAVIVGLSVLDVLLREGVLAWEAHLGGFLAGGGMAAAVGSRARGRRRRRGGA